MNALLSPAEKARRTRTFRRKALLSDLTALLLLADALACRHFSAASIPVPLFWSLPLLLAAFLACLLAAFRRCPFCGRLRRREDRTAGPFFWRAWSCPECGFTPNWDKRHPGGPS